MAVKRFLVTRPLAQSESFAADVRARGFEALVAPLTTVQFLDPATPVADYSLILITSANGAHALARLWPACGVPILAVGPQTAAALVAAGFGAVTSADGDAAALVRHVATLCPSGCRLLHVTGRGGQVLAIPGCKVDRLEAYDMVAASSLSDETIQALRNDTLDGVFCFSPASAALFRDLVLQDGVEDACTKLSAHCISPTVADMLKPLAFAYFYIAKRPNRAALLDTLPTARAG